MQRAWNSTGQKHAGDPSIATHLYGPLSPVVWLLVLATLLTTGNEISNITLQKCGLRKNIAGAVSAVLVTSTLVFKMAYTWKDEPELLAFWKIEEVVGMFRGLDLVGAARLVFFGLSTCGLYVGVARALGWDKDFRGHSGQY